MLTEVWFDAFFAIQIKEPKISDVLKQFLL